ncbi:fatty acyl-CoA reductase 2-like [Anopheles aquasalis]|uniref:fatty acyl-CoA reductase 2-like n=1 Tax=Anopheles aquasalis TaxID=42839 RepID=UPI00215B4685|nr:fatty acyl-CoA reductase 2-like [Anopheles aquasalis]
MSSISAFYRDKVVFVTGGTGFIGKIVVEKLLRTCEVKEVILMVREKKNTQPEQRIKTLCSSPIFERLAKKNPNYQERIRVIEGDLEKPNFDICPESMDYLKEHTNVILHIAATVKFDEEMIKAVNINLAGTRTALEIGRQAKNLQSFVYVSTAYSNSYDEYIQERIYPLDIDPEKILANLDDEKTKQDLIKYSLKWPNTYTFTKALAETLTLEYRKHFPVAILRPSCVMASLNEPVPGWCDNIYGSNGTFIGWYYGLIRTSHIHPEVMIDTVPVDYVSNAIIAIGWKTYVRRIEEPEVLVYNCVSSTDNPLTFDERRRECEKACKKHPLLTGIYKPVTFASGNELVFRVYSLLLHYLPAFFMDMAMRFRGEKPRLVDTYIKIDKVVASVQKFANTSYFFDNHNMKDLYLEMSPVDHQHFPCDNRNYSWRLYFEVVIPGLKKYFFKEDLNNVVQARQAMRKKELIVNSVLFLLLALILWQLYYLLA